MTFEVFASYAVLVCLAVTLIAALGTAWNVACIWRNCNAIEKRQAGRR